MTGARLSAFGLLGVLFWLCSPARVAGAEIALSGGVFNYARSEDAVEVGAQIRLSPQVFRLVPHLGIHLTSDEAVFGYVGVRRPIAISRRWLLVPSFAVAAFEKGNGWDLGQVLEFRSGLDLSRRLGNGTELSFGFYHMSNGSLSEVNPGANSLLLSYAFGR